MERVWWRVRRVCMVIVAGASIGAGMVALWKMDSPQRLAEAGTWTLVGVLGLVILPLLSIAAWDLDRRAAIEHPEADETPAVRHARGRVEPANEEGHGVTPRSVEQMRRTRHAAHSRHGAARSNY